MDSATQCSRLLKTLKENNKHGTPNYAFPRMGILKYSSRITDLRHDGHNIIAIRQKVNGRATGVWLYYLNDSEEEQVKPSFLDRLKHAVV